MCPTGTFKDNEEYCETCHLPCKTCLDKLHCTKCFVKSAFPYLFDKDCLSQCPLTHTNVGNECVRCKSPCGSCEEGRIESCLSCDNTGGKQFLHGTNCVAECPVNTTLHEASKACKDCKEGCRLCDSFDTSLCRLCAEGQALLEGECYEECPKTHIKSADGTACELRLYPLDENFIAFPVLGTAVFFTSITLASHWLTA